MTDTDPTETPTDTTDPGPTDTGDPAAPTGDPTGADGPVDPVDPVDGDDASRRRITDFDVIAFDADDTLWRSEDSFQRAELTFDSLVRPYVPEGVDLRDSLHAIERNDIPIQGYGVKAFTLSMVRAAVRMTGGEIPASVIGEIVDLSEEMLLEPVDLLPGVPETLHRVGLEARLVIITKGDLIHQLRKVGTSGLGHHFSDVEVVHEKDPDVYRVVTKRLGVSPDRFLMVGNSVRSDVLPVLAIGGHAVHVPYHLTWELERVDEHDEDVVELESIGELPGWLGL